MELLTVVTLEVGSYWHVSSEAIGGKPVRWLFDLYELVQKAKYQREVVEISQMEIAFLRALIQFHSKRRRLPPLPTYEQSIAAEERATTPVEVKRPAWMARYEEVNKGRLLARRSRRKAEDINSGKN